MVLWNEGYRIKVLFFYHVVGWVLEWKCLILNITMLLIKLNYLLYKILLLNILLLVVFISTYKYFYY